MSLLIDGYNLLHATGIMGRGMGPGGLERSRLALVNFLAASLEPEELPQTTVVFDAHNAPGLSEVVEHRGIRVRFASKHASADELIEELIRADSRRGGWWWFPAITASSGPPGGAGPRRSIATFGTPSWCAGGGSGTKRLP